MSPIGAYKQVPKIKKDRTCPFCHSYVSDYIHQAVIFYNGSINNSLSSKVRLAYCSECNLAFSDKQQLILNKDGSTFHAALFGISSLMELQSVKNRVNRDPLYPPTTNKNTKDISYSDLVAKCPTKTVSDKKGGCNPLRKGLNTPARNHTIKGYRIVPTGHLNSTAFKKETFLTNYTCDRCVVCQKQLVPFINFYPINEAEGIKVPGKFCTRCDAFYDSHGLDLFQALKEKNVSGDYIFHTEYVIPQYAEKRNFAKNIQSATVIVCLKEHSQNVHRTIIIVSSRNEANHEEDIFHYTHIFAREILLRLQQHVKYVCIEGKEYDILSSTNMNHHKTSDPLSTSIEKVLLRSGGGLYHGFRNDGTQLVDIR